MVPVIKTTIEDDKPLFSDVKERSGRYVSLAAASPQLKLWTNAEQRKPTARQQDRSVHVNGPKEITHQVIIPVKIETGSGITQINKLSDNNWVNWWQDILRMLTFLKVKGYPLGLVPRPDPVLNPEINEAWIHNNSYTLYLISLTLSESQKIHISQQNMSNVAWTLLTDFHEMQDHDTITSWLKSLFQTVAEEGPDISKHISKLLNWYEQIKVTDNPEIQITDTLFQLIITNSLPASWNFFTKAYVHCHTGIPEIDYKMHIPSSKLISIIKEEYEHRVFKQNCNKAVNHESSSATI